jgi:hypothetical protein
MHFSTVANDTFTLVALLHRDLPKYHFCEHCRLLHPGIPGLRPTSFRQFDDARVGFRHILVKTIQRSLLHLRVRSYLPWMGTAIGLFFLRLDWHQFLDGIRYVSTAYETDCNLQMLSIFRQINKTLFFRIQSVALLPWQNGYSHVKLPRDTSSFWVPCCIDTSDRARERQIWEAMECKSIRWNSVSDSCRQHPVDSVYQCQSCMTEYQVSQISETDFVVPKNSMTCPQNSAY